MAPRRPDPRGPESVSAVLRALDSGAAPGADDQRVAARYLLYTLAARHPGRVLEVRIPPVAAVQCLPGPVHTRGWPPAGSTGPARSAPAPSTPAARVPILPPTCRSYELRALRPGSG